MPAAVLFALALAAEGPGGPPRGPGPAIGLFISPAGKPFRGGPDRPEPREQWWREADADRDGGLDRSEMVADAVAFFVTLDLDHDGSLDGSEVRRYETEIAPEILRPGPPIGAGGRPGDQRQPAGISRPKPRAAGGPRPIPLEGAARFGLLNDPQPIMSADYDLSRRVTKAEFERKARELFVELDQNRDGRLTMSELPPPRGPGPR